jgi:eukaryotic-like serine/threonine-protein kinase
MVAKLFLICVTIWSAFGLAMAAASLAVGQMVPSASTVPAVVFAAPDVDGPAVSPDGSAVAFLHEHTLWVRRLGELEPHRLTGTINAEGPFWSPDNKSLGFFQGDELRKIPSAGGASELICRLPVSRQTRFSDMKYVEGTWGANDTIVFRVGRDGLFEVPAQGGATKLFAKAKEGWDEADLEDPKFLPDGRMLLLQVRKREGRLYPDTVAVESGGERRVVLQIPGAILNQIAISAKTGHLLYHQFSPDPGIWAVPISFPSLRTTGEPFLVAAGGATPSVSRDGTLVFLSGVGDFQELAWVDRSGKELESFGGPRDEIYEPSVAPDGTRIAFDTDGFRELWVHDLPRNKTVKVSGSWAMAYSPAWTPDGSTLVFGCRSSSTGSYGEICMAREGASNAPIMLGEGYQPFEISLSHDGKSVVFTNLNQVGNFDILQVPLKEGIKPVPFLATAFNERAPQVSPDGHFMAYQSDKTGRYEVYVRPFPMSAGLWQISTRGGTNPKWNPQGTELFYLNGTKLMVVPIHGPPFKPGTPRALISGRVLHSEIHGSSLYDVAPDGTRFVVVRSASGTPSIVATDNWWKADQQSR